MLLRLILLSFFRDLLGVFGDFFQVLFGDFLDVLDVDLSSLFIVGNRLIEFSWILILTIKDRNF
jgi:hypothetical protein